MAKIKVKSTTTQKLKHIANCLKKGKPRKQKPKHGNKLKGRSTSGSGRRRRV